MTVDPVIVLDSVLRTSRLLVTVAAGLVVFDALHIKMIGNERPPHKPVQNALAWSLMAVSVGLLALALLSLNMTGLVLTEMSPLRLLAIGSWCGLAVALIWRVAMRSFRPALTWLAMGIMTIGGFSLTLLFHGGA